MSEAPEAFDPKADDFMNAPHEFYRRLRAQAPVWRDPRHDIYFVTSYELVSEVMKDAARFSSSVDRASMRAGGLPARVHEIRKAGWVPAPTMSGNDAPSHDVFKDLVSPWFTPRNLGRFEPYVREQVAALLDAWPRGEPVDFVSAFAVPLPIAVIGHALGMNQYGTDTLKAWSDAFADEIGMLTSEARAIEIAELTVACQQAMIETCDARRDNPEEDICSMLATARVPVVLEDGVDATGGDERPLNEAELVSILTQLLVAGNETTTNTLSGGARRLATEPQLWQQLQSDPGQIPRFVEELLRLESPVQGQFRQATEDLTLGGVAIPAGALLHVRLASANRDEALYGEDDDVLRVHGSKRPPHKAFGMGMHFCVGAMLSRLELKVAFEQLVGRFDRLQLAAPDDPLRYHTHFHLRGLEALPVTLE